MTGSIAVGREGVGQEPEGRMVTSHLQTIVTGKTCSEH